MGVVCVGFRFRFNLQPVKHPFLRRTLCGLGDEQAFLKRTSLSRYVFSLQLFAFLARLWFCRMPADK